MDQMSPAKIMDVGVSSRTPLVWTARPHLERCCRAYGISCGVQSLLPLTSWLNSHLVIRPVSTSLPCDVSLAAFLRTIPVFANVMEMKKCHFMEPGRKIENPIIVARYSEKGFEARVWSVLPSVRQTLKESCLRVHTDTLLAVSRENRQAWAERGG